MPYKQTVVNQCHQLCGTVQTTMSRLTQEPGFPRLIYHELFTSWYRRHAKDTTSTPRPRLPARASAVSANRTQRMTFYWHSVRRRGTPSRLGEMAGIALPTVGINVIKSFEISDRNRPALRSVQTSRPKHHTPPPQPDKNGFEPSLEMECVSVFSLEVPSTRPDV
jgi:hypothetical protein